MPFPPDGRWAVFFGPGTMVDTGVPVVRPPRMVAIPNEIIVPSDNFGTLGFTSYNTTVLTIPEGLQIGFRVDILQLNDGVVNVVGAEGVTIINSQGNSASAGKGSMCSLYGYAWNQYILTGETGLPGTVSEPATAAPVNVDVPLVMGTGTVGETLNCTMGNWEGEPDTYAYRWLRDGETEIGTDDSYVIAQTDVGYAINCVVTATNAVGSTEAPPSNSIAVA